MNLRNELAVEHCFEVKEDTPSLSVTLKGGAQVMLLYSRLERAEFKSGKIIADFNSEILSVAGQNLENIWEHFQLFELRTLKMSRIKKELNPECQIDKLELCYKSQD